MTDPDSIYHQIVGAANAGNRPPLRLRMWLRLHAASHLWARVFIEPTTTVHSEDTARSMLRVIDAALYALPAMTDEDLVPFLRDEHLVGFLGWFRERQR